MSGESFLHSNHQSNLRVFALGSYRRSPDWAAALVDCSGVVEVVVVEDSAGIVEEAPAAPISFSAATVEVVLEPEQLAAIRPISAVAAMIDLVELIFSTPFRVETTGVAELVVLTVDNPTIW